MPINGFPLLPHLSHGDGRKLDIAYYYRDANGSYMSGVTRSPIGYLAFEQRGAGDAPSPCRADVRLTMRWDMTPEGEVIWEMYFKYRPLEPERTRAALKEAKRRGVVLGRNGKVLAQHHREQAMERARKLDPVIRPMLTEGMTFSGIARSLNADGFRTERGSNFYPETVKQIARRLIESDL